MTEKFCGMVSVWAKELDNPEISRGGIFLDKIDDYEVSDPVGDMVADRLDRIIFVDNAIKDTLLDKKNLYVFYFFNLCEGISFKKLRSEFGLPIGRNKFYRIRDYILEEIWTRIKNTSYSGTIF